MSFRNNNQQAVRELARAYGRQNRRQNRMLTVAVATAVFLLYFVFSVAWGKLRSDYLIDLRGMGTAANVSLERGSYRQYKTMKSLPYLADVGIQKIVGTVSREGWQADLVFLDDTAYEKLMKPAYTDISGNYPARAQELMLPLRCLQQLGISTPSPGMELEMNICLPGGTEESFSFVLSGYYTDYIDFSVAESKAYISEEFLAARSIPVFPADKLMARSLQGRNQVETSLYGDLTMEDETQQVFGENPMVKQSVEGTFGSLAIALVCGLLVVICAFALTLNVITISLERSIRQYGLLKVIGTTDRQLRELLSRLSLESILRGLLLGAVISMAAVKLFLPPALQLLFMEGLGPSDTGGFYPLLLAGAVLLTLLASSLASCTALRRVICRSAMESVRYVETDSSRKSSGSVRLLFAEMAWKNMTRSRRRLLISLLTLVLGFVTALGSAVVMRGTDRTYQLRQRPDFQLGILAGISRFPELVPEKINDYTPVFSENFLSAIANMEEIDHRGMEITSGSYAVVDFQRDEALKPRQKSLTSKREGLSFATLQIVDEKFVKLLEDYVTERQLPVDMSSFGRGAGCILLHHRELSLSLQEQTARTLNLPIHFYSLEAYSTAAAEIASNASGDGSSLEKGSLLCSGYLDMTGEGFPKLQTTSLGNDTVYFIMTEKAFQSLNLPQKVFDLSFDLLPGQDETLVNQKLSQLLQQENRSTGIMDTFYLSANYTLLKAEENRILGADILLGGMSAILLFIGVMNYGNTLTASLTVRRKEMAIMRSLGLTRGQMWKLLAMEGLEYWLIAMGITATLGSAAIWILGKAIRVRLSYFTFSYPWRTLLALGLILLIICILFAARAFLPTRGSENILEELRKNSD